MIGRTRRRSRVAMAQLYLPAKNDVYRILRNLALGEKLMASYICTSSEEVCRVCDDLSLSKPGHLQVFHSRHVRRQEIQLLVSCSHHLLFQHAIKISPSDHETITITFYHD